MLTKEVPIFFIFFSHNASSRSQLKGRHQAQLKQVEISSDEMSEMTWMQLKRVCRDIPVQDNFYLSWWLRGQRGYNPLIRPHFCSPYVTKQGFTRLKVSWTFGNIYKIYSTKSVAIIYNRSSYFETFHSASEGMCAKYNNSIIIKGKNGNGVFKKHM